MFSTLDHVSKAIEVAQSCFHEWNKLGYESRCEKLERLADLLEDHLPELVALCHKEAGKTIHDSIDEVREAVDFVDTMPNNQPSLHRANKLVSMVLNAP